MYAFTYPDSSACCQYIFLVAAQAKLPVAGLQLSLRNYVKQKKKKLGGRKHVN